VEHGATGLSTREVRLVEVLLRHPDGLTAGDIADQLRVSARTVHRDLQAASDFLGSHGLTLVGQAGRAMSVRPRWPCFTLARPPSSGPPSLFTSSTSLWR
jgi:hypothetical protein